MGVRGIALEIDAVDANASTLESDRGLSGDFPEIRFLRGNVLTFEGPHTYARPRAVGRAHVFRRVVRFEKAGAGVGGGAVKKTPSS